MGIVTKGSDQIYQYLNFNQIDEYVEAAKGSGLSQPLMKTSDTALQVVSGYLQ
jgi:hypothetical protein